MHKNLSLILDVNKLRGPGYLANSVSLFRDKTLAGDGCVRAAQCRRDHATGGLLHPPQLQVLRYHHRRRADRCSYGGELGGVSFVIE